MVFRSCPKQQKIGPWLDGTCVSVIVFCNQCLPLFCYVNLSIATLLLIGKDIAHSSFYCKKKKKKKKALDPALTSSKPEKLA